MCLIDMHLVLSKVEPTRSSASNLFFRAGRGGPRAARELHALQSADAVVMANLMPKGGNRVMVCTVPSALSNAQRLQEAIRSRQMPGHVRTVQIACRKRGEGEE